MFVYLFSPDLFRYIDAQNMQVAEFKMLHCPLRCSHRPHHMFHKLFQTAPKPFNNYVCCMWLGPQTKKRQKGRIEDGHDRGKSRREEKVAIKTKGKPGRWRGEKRKNGAHSSLNEKLI